MSALPGSDISHSGGAVQVLLLATLALLFLPKILAMFLAIPKAGQFGGAVRLVASTLIETAIWTLLAPAIMLYYTQFVVMNLAGLHVRWTARNRSDTGLGFLESFHIFWMPPVIGVIATTVLAIWARDELWLLSPILVGCLIAPVLAWMTSQPKLGEWARRHRLFLTPEENPELCPAELRFVDQAAAVSTNSLSLPFGGIARAVIDPLTHSVHVVLLRQRKAGGLQTEGYLVGLRQKLIEEGPAALEPSQLYALLWDADSMRWLHREFWSRPAVRLHPWWRERLDDVIEKIGLTS